MVLKSTIKFWLRITTVAIASAALLFVALNTAQAKRIDVLPEQQLALGQLHSKSHNTNLQGTIFVAQGAKRVISPTQAVRAAMGSSPGGQALGVRYNAARGGYVVRIRVGGRLLKLFVNGRTGRVGR